MKNDLIQDYEENKKEIHIEHVITDEDVKKFFENIESKKEIDIKDFNLYKKIKKDNLISPLMIFILQNAIDKYNNKIEEVCEGFEGTGFGQFPGISNKEIENNKTYFCSEKARVLYATFSEEFIGLFWNNHQLLKDLLHINPDKTVLSSELKLAEIEKTKNKSSSSFISVSSNSNSKKNKKGLNNESPENEEDKRNRINNKEFNKLSKGANFEYNTLHFLLYGIKNYINFPRIVFYPVVNYMDYEEIDSAFLVKEMKNLELYYSNFRSIDINNCENERKAFKLEQNDIVFIEATFELDSKGDKVLDFMKKIIKFISLYQDIGLINNLNDYNIKPIVLYNNNYNLNENNLNNIKTAIDLIKKIIEKYNNDKLEEIYKNLQIIYCWPTIPIVNNITTYKHLSQKFEIFKKEYEENINNLKINYEENINNLKINYEQNNNNLKNEIKQLKKLIHRRTYNKYYYNNYRNNNYKYNLTNKSNNINYINNKIPRNTNCIYKYDIIILNNQWNNNKYIYAINNNNSRKYNNNYHYNNYHYNNYHYKKYYY